MANPEHLEILKQGVEAWNRWRLENPHLIPDLSQASFAATNFSGANFSKVHMWEAGFLKVALRKTDFRSADLRVAIFRSADLRGAILAGSNLVHARFVESNLTEAVFGATVFGGTYLRRAVNLDKCIIESPCTLDGLTISRSWPLPDDFLRGCGLLDWEIEAAKLYAGRLSQKQITDIVYQIKENAPNRGETASPVVVWCLAKTTIQPRRRSWLIIVRFWISCCG